MANGIAEMPRLKDSSVLGIRVAAVLNDGESNTGSSTMIRILGKNEAAAEHPSDLVGRYVGKEGVMRFRTYGRPALVTGYSGGRLYIRPAQVNMKARDGDGSFFLPEQEWDEEEYIQMKSVAYVCDTVDECEMVMVAGRKAIRIWQEGEAQIKRDIDQVFAELSHDGASPPKP